MNDLRYCFEQSLVPSILLKTSKSGLAVIDTDGISKSAIQSAVNRGVYVYGYINAGACEDARSYYKSFKYDRLAPYDGWDGEYWIDVTDKAWQEHVVDIAKTIKATGAIGVYLDNTDLYGYIRDREIKKRYSRALPSADAVYKVLSALVFAVQKVGLIVMPNGGDVFVADR